MITEKFSYLEKGTTTKCKTGIISEIQLNEFVPKYTMNTKIQPLCTDIDC